MTSERSFGKCAIFKGVIVEHLIPKPWASKASTLLVSGFPPEFGKWLQGFCSHSASRALGTSNTEVGWLGLARSLCSSSSQRCWMWLKSGLCAGEASSSTPNWENQSIRELTLSLYHSLYERTFRNCCETFDSTVLPDKVKGRFHWLNTSKNFGHRVIDMRIKSLN